MSLYPLVDRVVRRVREIPQRGLPALRPNSCSFDAEWGVETTQLVWLTSPFSKNYGHGYRYEGCDPSACTWAIRTSAVNTRDFYFVDIGCGKGRAMLVASRFEFARLLGVEYSHRLCKQCEKNLLHCAISRERFRVICQDATEFVFPEHASIVYFYNPFDGEILNTVLSRLRPVAERNPTFVAFEGKNRFLLDRRPWLRRVAEGPNVLLFAAA